MRSLLVLAVLAGSFLSACASTRPLSPTQNLALYEANAGAPVRDIIYTNPIGWEKVDDQHVLLSMSPTKAYLLRISGPCLSSGGATPAIVVTAQASRLTAGFDRLGTGASPARCRIEEIRPVDVAAVRTSRAAME